MGGQWWGGGKHKVEQEPVFVIIIMIFITKQRLIPSAVHINIFIFSNDNKGKNKHLQLL